MVNGVNSFLVLKTSMEVYIFYLQSGAKIYIGRLEEVIFNNEYTSI